MSKSSDPSFECHRSTRDRRRVSTFKRSALFTEDLEEDDSRYHHPRKRISSPKDGELFDRAGKWYLLIKN